jgi:drug/metabolite transporter (DMT)-like permease
MISLLLAILFSSFLYLIFKIYLKFKINTLHAIVFNYIFAFSVGFLTNPFHFNFNSLLNKPWLPSSIFLGFMFIFVFNILGKTTQVNGITAASVSSKMSMIIPILFGIFFFNENIGIYKIIGIVIAFFAVYFTSKKEKTEIHSSNLTLPTLLFLGAGIIDTCMNYTQHHYIQTDETCMFTSMTFVFAFMFGLLHLGYTSIKTKIEIKIKNIIAGIALGIPNYYSMFFLIKALQNQKLESATTFTLINIGVILLTAIFSIFLFKEKLKKYNYIGIILAIITVLLVTF